MKTVRDVCGVIGALVPSFPVCVETGCMYVCDSGNEIHTTTNNILEYICNPNQGRLISYDIDSTHIDYAQAFINKYVGKSEVVFVLGDSAVQMANLAAPLHEVRASFPEDHPDGNPFLIDVLCLDSKEFDEDHMVNEFNAVKDFLKKDKHFVLVDDIHNGNSVKYKKMVPILKELGYNWTEVSTPTGMFVAWKGYKLP